jgi:hypothetical protein
MARLLKNTEINTQSTAIRLPDGSSAVRPAVPVNGQVRYNTTTNVFEFYANGAYMTVAKVGNVAVAKSTFTTANAQSTYGPVASPYPQSGDEANVLVFVGGVYQTPTTNYTFNGNGNIQLNPTNGTAGQTIIVLQNFNSTNAV